MLPTMSEATLIDNHSLVDVLLQAQSVLDIRRGFLAVLGRISHSCCAWAIAVACQPRGCGRFSSSVDQLFSFDPDPREALRAQVGSRWAACCVAELMSARQLALFAPLLENLWNRDALSRLL